MKALRISISLPLLVLLLLASPGTSASASYNDAVCGQFNHKLESALKSGGPAAMQKEMSRLLRIQRIDEMGMVPEEGVRCALIASDDVYMVVNVALAAGIDREILRRGIERHFRFRDLQVPDLGIFETAGRMRMEINVFGGVSIENTVVDATVNNEDVRLDGGGGYGGGITIGYGITPNLDFDLALGYHVTALDPKTQDTEGSFERYSALASLKRRFYTSARSWVKLGIGAGYFSPVMYRKGSDLGGYAEIEYDNAPGGTVSLEYEAAIGEHTVSSSFVLGLRYCYVVYDALKVTDAGVEQPLSSLPPELLELDGSSAEITAGIATYF